MWLAGARCLHTRSTHTHAHSPSGKAPGKARGVSCLLPRPNLFSQIAALPAAAPLPRLLPCRRTVSYSAHGTEGTPRYAAANSCPDNPALSSSRRRGRGSASARQRRRLRAPGRELTAEGWSPGTLAGGRRPARGAAPSSFPLYPGGSAGGQTALPAQAARHSPGRGQGLKVFGIKVNGIEELSRSEKASTSAFFMRGKPRPKSSES
uniref:uncharacterized protein LOC118539125 n=1 Tax=Halichoerus grypus TaxID=9711 RepID=UPI00165983E1|nr:uncharacterized protein LOC118539125 [Halichoerus grypus]